VAVSHCRGALGYLIEHEGRKTAYLPDTGPLPENSMSLLKKVDTLILDATFHGENWYPEQHLSVDEAIQIARELEVGKLYLTHLSMHYSQPVTNEILQCEIAEQQGLVDLAYDGLRLPLTGAHQ
jgi:phosphoribosyl 1,2-cyclic phosphate phosphodiesterase